MSAQVPQLHRPTPQVPSTTPGELSQPPTSQEMLRPCKAKTGQTMHTKMHQRPKRPKKIALAGRCQRHRLMAAACGLTEEYTSSLATSFPPRRSHQDAPIETTNVKAARMVAQTSGAIVAASDMTYRVPSQGKACQITASRPDEVYNVKESGLKAKESQAMSTGATSQSHTKIARFFTACRSPNSEKSLLGSPSLVEKRTVFTASRRQNSPCALTPLMSFVSRNRLHLQRPLSRKTSRSVTTVPGRLASG
mmetsp:Transcript_27070/g.32992  ORF Transcript_27070/g.32992 Transcript_27070/m.32992 type:complete len:250 (-) Transcript_27070:131-880(-)